jgi:serine/threonine protein kinase
LAFAVTEPMDAPQHVGRYETVQLLGRGGMGAVFLARDPLIDRLVAVKVLPAGFDDAARARFAREARAAGRLQHENIATIFDVGEHDGAPFIAMEYVPGQTLAALIRRPARLDLTETLRLLEDACAGLAFAHRAGIVHLDVKPENLMRRDDGRLKILDFGIARVVEADQTHTRHLLGTLRYMSPEQLRGGPVDRRADVFALGCVLYEVIARTPAFTGEITEILPRAQGHEPTPLTQLVPGVHPELVRMTRRAMAHDPADRYGDLDVLGRELAALRHATDAGADYVTGAVLASPDTVRPARPPGSTHRRRYIGAAGVLAAAGLATLAWAVLPELTRSPQLTRSADISPGPVPAGRPPTESTPATPNPPPDGTSPAAAAAPEAVALESEIDTARKALRSADRAATLKLLRERPYLAVALIDELTAFARVAADEAKRSADRGDASARRSPDYRSALRDLDRAQALESSGQRIESLAALWQAADGFGRATTPSRSSGPAPAQRADAPAAIGRATPAKDSAASPAVTEIQASATSRPDTSTAVPTPGPVPPVPPPVVEPPPASPAERVSPTEPLPAPREVPNTRSPEDAVRATLFTYAAAYELRDITAVRSVFPGLPPEQAAVLSRTFASAVSYRLTVRVLDIQVAQTSAVATCEVKHELVPKVGSPSSNVLHSRFSLRQADGAWIIDRIERAAGR